MSTTPTNKTRAGNIPAIERATGQTWSEWVAFFEAQDAAAKNHGEIAALGRSRMPADLENPDWWAQAVAIAFEQHAGLRVPGQSASGTFRVSASRTLPLSRSAALEAWIEQFGAEESHLGHAVSNKRDSATEKRSFHRFSLEGAGKVEVSATPKSAESTNLTISQEGLPTGERIEEWRTYWKAQLTRL